LKLDDDVTISSLRHEMEKAVGRADLMTARELAAKQLISELQREVDNLRSRLAAEQARTSGAASTTAPLENSVTTFGAAAKTDSIPTPPARPLLTPNQYANSFEVRTFIYPADSYQTSNLCIFSYLGVEESEVDPSLQVKKRSMRRAEGGTNRTAREDPIKASCLSRKRGNGRFSAVSTSYILFIGTVV
jgi:hypothetical protein